MEKGVIWHISKSRQMRLLLQEMDPTSKRFKRILSNPMAYVPFKATEPWLVEYINFDLHEALHEIGFCNIQSKASTPGHFTLAATKPDRATT